MPENVVWHRLGFNPGISDKLRRTITLTKLLRRIHCQAFIGFVMSADKTVYTACLLSKTPIIVAERNSPDMYDLKYNRFAKLLYMVLFSFAKRVVIQIEDYRTAYPKWLQSNIKVIPNPVYKIDNLSQPAKKLQNKWTLLCVARLEYQKNIETLINAFSKLCCEFSDWNLRIVGEGAQRNKLEMLISDLALADRVSLTGAISDVDKEYQSAHLFCLPSRWEGFPNALAEAMAHGLPVVGFADCPGVNSLITDGFDGLLAIGNGDENTLTYSLKILMSDSELREKIGQQATLITERYNPKKITEQWENVLRDTISG
jgi:glycosyltransferase involved in cell wall biosynthesis